MLQQSYNRATLMPRYTDLSPGGHLYVAYDTFILRPAVAPFTKMV